MHDISKPTWMVDVYGFRVGKFTDIPWNLSFELVSWHFEVPAKDLGFFALQKKCRKAMKGEGSHGKPKFLGWSPTRAHAAKPKFFWVPTLCRLGDASARWFFFAILRQLLWGDCFCILPCPCTKQLLQSLNDWIAAKVCDVHVKDWRRIHGWQGLGICYASRQEHIRLCSAEPFATRFGGWFGTTSCPPETNSWQRCHFDGKIIFSPYFPGAVLASGSVYSLFQRKEAWIITWRFAKNMSSTPSHQLYADVHVTGI